MQEIVVVSAYEKFPALQEKKPGKPLQEVRPSEQLSRPVKGTPKGERPDRTSIFERENERAKCTTELHRAQRTLETVPNELPRANRAAGLHGMGGNWKRGRGSEREPPAQRGTHI